MRWRCRRQVLRRGRTAVRAVTITSMPDAIFWSISDAGVISSGESANISRSVFVTSSASALPPCRRSENPPGYVATSSPCSAPNAGVKNARGWKSPELSLMNVGASKIAVTTKREARAGRRAGISGGEQGLELLRRERLELCSIADPQTGLVGVRLDDARSPPGPPDPEPGRRGRAAGRRRPRTSRSTLIAARKSR